MKLVLNTAVVLAFVSGSTVSGPGQAADWIKPGEERFKIGAGVFLPSFNTDLRINATDVGGSGTDLEDDLGLREDDTTFWGTAEWRMAPRHRLGISYFSFTRDGSITAQRDIEIGDGQIIDAGASVFTKFEFDVIPIDYSYSFIKNDKHEFAGTVGLHWYEMAFNVNATAWVQDDRGTESVSAKAEAPLPLIGLRYDYHISPRWSVNAKGQVFALDLNDDTFAFSGSLYNFRLGTEYWLWNNFGVGAAVNTFGLDVDVDDSDWKGSLKYSYWGPQIYAVGRF